MSKKKTDEPGYGEASTELEQILQAIENDELDLDVLSEKVERAAALLAICRSKLAATELKVRKVVAEVSAAAEQADGGAAEDDDA